VVPSLALRRWPCPDRARNGRVAAGAIALALALDALLGEPPNAVHPVAGVGRVIGWLQARAPRGRVPELAHGAGMALSVPCGAAGLGIVVARLAAKLPAPWKALALAAGLKPAFALRALLEGGEHVRAALAAGELEQARGAAAALVSRPTAELDEPLVAAAAIESLAENLTDSVLAPLLAFAVFGLPGAYAYRAVNTLDSMIGYHGALEWLGKAAARLDDAANLLPARLGAALVVCAAFAGDTSASGALRAALGQHARTASPNAGWTMAATAGALGVRLEKMEHYVLNPCGAAPASHDVARAARLVRRAALGGAALAMALAWWVRRP
jgi:adenosylcobinamide-phosphate synthase